VKRLIAVALFLSACGGGGTEATAAPALVRVPQYEVDIAAFAPAPDGGTGVIAFGITVDPDTFQIPKALTRFKRTYPEIAWSANLTRAVDSPFVTWVVARQSTSGVEKTLFDVEEPTDPGVTILANSGDLAALVDNAPGTYVMRYLDSKEVLAEGTFTLVK